MSSILKVDQLQDSGGNNLITSNGSGVITAAGFGKIGQVIYEENTTNNMITTSTTSVDVEFDSTVFTASITPSSTSSKILCMGVLPIRSAFSGNDGKFGMSVHAKIGTGSYNRIYGRTGDSTYFGGYDYGGSGLQFGISVPINVLYSPNTTSVVTFKYQVLNRGASASLTVNRGQVGTSFTLMEVLP